MDKAESFVFYRSFAETARLVESDADRLELYEGLITYGLTGEKPPLRYPLNAILEQMTASVKAAADRYAAAKENGEKGGRPKKYIPPEEWKAFRKEHSQKETAEHFGISVDTLQRWEKTAKPQNLNNNINDNLNLNVNSNSNSNYKKNNINNKGGTPSQPQSGSAPRPMMPGYEFIHNGKQWRINDRGVAEVIGTAE